MLWVQAIVHMVMKNDVLNVFQAIIAKAWSNNGIQNYLNLFTLVSFTKLNILIQVVL